MPAKLEAEADADHAQKRDTSDQKHVTSGRCG
jgi:hypothetical protein